MTPLLSPENFTLKLEPSIANLLPKEKTELKNEREQRKNVIVILKKEADEI